MNIPAFPNGGFQNGMSLRDYFAGQAIIAFIDKDVDPVSENISDEYISVRAYELADAMLKVRRGI